MGEQFVGRIDLGERLEQRQGVRHVGMQRHRGGGETTNEWIRVRELPTDPFRHRPIPLGQLANGRQNLGLYERREWSIARVIGGDAGPERRRVARQPHGQRRPGRVHRKTRGGGDRCRVAPTLQFERRVPADREVRVGQPFH